MHSPDLLFIGNLFGGDMIIILVIALMLFGGEKLPEIARGLGKGLRDFKDASEGIKREINDQINSYEEKKQEQKMEEAIKISQENQNAAPVVENTIPFNEFNAAEHPHEGGESHETPNHELATHDHPAPGHTDSTSSTH